MSIKKKNVKFDTLSKSDKRKEIAKDVIYQIRAKKLIAESGTYLEIDDNLSCKIGDSLQKLLKKNQPVCKVCGIGAAFIGAIRKFNQYDITEQDLDYTDENLEAPDDYSMRETLRKYFSSEQLSLIECAFECSNGFSDNGISASYIQKEKARDFGYKYDKDEGRLIAIMQKIAKNKRGLLQF